MTERLQLHPDPPGKPEYWRNDASGKLVPAMERYLKRESGKPDDVSLIRGYLRQWVDSPAWEEGAGGEQRLQLAVLRARVRWLHNRLDFDLWIQDATEFGIDPL
jgi:hypothetical protein